MITAKEAKKQSVFNSTLKKEMDAIENDIAAAVKVGKFHCLHSKWGTYTKEEEVLILEKLRELGFKVEYDRSGHPGCSCDQMDPYSYLKISWED